MLPAIKMIKTSVSYIWLYKYTDVNEQLILDYAVWTSLKAG